ncbi:MAG: aminotransferase class III-fold pyridoxal phosphate-dependent enzyme [Dongiaceae bacterium]
MDEAIGRTIDRSKLAALKCREIAVRDGRTRESRKLLERGRAAMPAGVPMAWMVGLYESPPLYVTHGEGARFWDVDGNAYLDMNQADLSMTCGFTPEPVLDAVARQIQNGPSFLLPGEDAIRVAELLGERFGLSHWQFTLSATGANAEAIRVARAATGRDKSLMFNGHYHGHADEMLAAGGGYSNTGYLGLPADAPRRADTIAFNDIDALRASLQTRNYACLIAEPALTNCGLVLPDEGFWAAARAACSETDTLLLLDETHTQTFAWGGMVRAWGLEPDMVTVGKCIGGGLPMGAYGMGPTLAALMEQHLDRQRGAAALPTGGTMFANALAMAASRAALEEVLTEDGYSRVAALGRQMADGLNETFARHGLAWRAPRLGGRSGWCLEPRLPRNADEAGRSIDYELIDARRIFMANRGIWDAIASAGPAVSFAHEPADVDEYLGVADAFLAEIV